MNTPKSYLYKETELDPTDPGHDVAVLREHVRHLERRVRQLAAEAAPQAAALSLLGHERKALAGICGFLFEDDMSTNTEALAASLSEEAAMWRGNGDENLSSMLDDAAAALRRLAGVEAERDALRAALLRVLDTREREAKAYLTAQVASENFSRRSAKADEHAHLQAAMEASKAEKEARELLAAMKGTQ